MVKRALEGATLRSAAVSRAIAVSCLLLVALSTTGLHCYSTPIWHESIDDSDPDELLLGGTRGIRSDDWMVQIPTAIAQRSSPDAFGPVNAAIGTDGIDLRVVNSIPLATWLGGFRPETWGYFVSDSFGVAWQWWFYVLGLFTASLLCSLLVTRDDKMVSLGVATAITLAPFFQLWAYRFTPIAIHALLCTFQAATFLSRPKVDRLAILAAVGATWSAGCLFLFLYPPYQIPFGFLCLALIIGLSISYGIQRQTALRVTVVLFACVLLGLILWRFTDETSHAIELMRGTVYPGRRVLAGGEGTAFSVFSGWLAPAYWIPDWRPLGNECEAARFLFLFPALTVLYLFVWLATRRIDPVAGALLGFVGLVSSWLWLGWPAWAATATGWSMVPTYRALMALGVADCLLLGRWIAVGHLPHSRAKWATIILTLALAMFVSDSAIENIPGLGVWIAAAFSLIILTGCAWLCANRWRPLPLVLGLLGAVSVAPKWNPLAYGAHYLTDNPLANAIERLDRSLTQEIREKPIWITYGSVPVANLLRMIGVTNLSGTHYTPQKGLWSVLDENTERSGIWNRFAHLEFELGEPDQFNFRLLVADAVGISMHPASKQFEALGIDAVVISLEGAPPTFDTLDLVESVGNHHLYKGKP